ncbi:uncharacterized protein LOC132742916 [Ruditapes philippinarum]|uniref:uncharacterized protein LOC132742916 n=1 Tax=Ruditapes philippinarum TaxID=129788 RepID=UPI00295BD3FE|nr:uncharacterized protein LOC132742916 [Ruditapes philippinarum]
MADGQTKNQKDIDNVTSGKAKSSSTSSSRGKQTAPNLSEDLPSTSKTSEKSSAKIADKNDEILNILKSLRAEQIKTNSKLEACENRLEQLENVDYSYDYDAYQYEPDMYVDEEASLASASEICPPVTGKRKIDDNNNPADKSESSEGSSRFARLSKRFKTTEVCGSDIDPFLADNVNHLFRQGMEEDQYFAMIKDEENPRPGNCDSLVTVKLNQLVWDIVSPTARSRDKKMQNMETTVIKAACVLVKTVDKAAKLETEVKQAGGDIGSVIDGCNDALAFLGHANRQINMIRRDLLKPEMRNEYNHLCTHSLPYTSQLFGDDVSKTAKEIEECSRIGHKLQYGPVRGSFRGRPGFRPRLRGTFNRTAVRGRGGYASSEYQQASKNLQRRGGVRKF